MEKLNLNNEQALHVQIMKKLLIAFQKKPMILKGGTALFLCYQSERFSEDIDLDAKNHFNLASDIKQVFEAYSDVTLVSLKVHKNTDTVKRYVLRYQTQYGLESLKIETSFRNGYDECKSQLIDNIRVYNITELIEQKTNVLQFRRKIRDLYDIHFLLTHYPEQFSSIHLARIKQLGGASNIVNIYQYSYEEDYLPEHISLEMLAIEIEDKLINQLEKG